MGNAGTAMRLFMGLLACAAFDSTLVGDESLMRRPMERVAKPLREMGARIDTHDGRPPVRISGGRALHGIDYAMPVASAQVKSAILLAGAARRGRDDRVASRPSPAITPSACCRLSAATSSRGPARSRCGRRQRLEAASVVVPGDFSSAAFFIVAACIGAREPFVIEGVGVNPTRTGLLEMLALMGADLRLREPPQRAGPSRWPTSRCGRRGCAASRVPERLVPLAIDEFPAFFVAAACAEGETVVTGAEELRVKESDRIAVMAAGLAALGVANEVLAGRPAHPGRPVRRRRPSTATGDHRIAMAFAVASLRASGADRDPRRGQRRDLVPGLRRDWRASVGHRDRGARLRCRPPCPFP